MLDALGRDRLRAQMRRARSEDLPGLRREAHRRAARAQRQDLADAAPVQGRGDGADGRVRMLRCQSYAGLRARKIWSGPMRLSLPASTTSPNVTASGQWRF